MPESKSLKNRLHLDLITSQVAEERPRLLTLGATLIRDLNENGGQWIFFADPEGDEFDLALAVAEHV